MTNLQLPPMDYQSLVARDTGKIGYATRIEKVGDTVTVFHHDSPIATLSPDWIHIDNHGYHTRTTSHRLNLITYANGLGWVGIKGGRMFYTPKDGGRALEFSQLSFEM